MSTAPSTPRGSGGVDALTTALMLTSRGFHVVAIHAGQKRPIGEGWGLDRPGVVTLRAKYNANPGAGVGLCLGPAKAPGGGWLIDVEGDGPAAAESLADLLGGELAETMGWGSVRGRHHLFEVDGRFLDLMRAAGAVEGKGASAGVFKLAALPDLEFRIGGTKPDGTVKQVQSVCPPTPGTDGAPRRWNGCWDVAPMPDAALAKLESIAELAAKLEADEPPVRATIPIEPFTTRASDGPSVPRYVAAAVEKELQALAGATEGGRNHRLNVSAMKLGQFVAAGTLSESEAVAGLEAAARTCGLTDPREVAATIRSGMAKGKAEPRDLSGVGVDRRMKPAAKGKPIAEPRPEHPIFDGPPRPITADLLPVPKLVGEMIPEPFRGWLQDVADRASLAVEYPTAAAITAVGGLIGRRLAMKPKRFDDWLVCPNVWGGVVGSPGVLKTHAAEEGLKPLHRLACEARERHEAAVKAHNAGALVVEAQMDAKKAELKKLAKTGAPGFQLENVAAEIAAMAEAQEPPRAKRYVVNDATVEKLGELLAENPNGLTVFRDELTGFLKAMDKQGHENDRQFYLEAWNGLSPGYTYDRIGRGTVFIPNVTLSLFGGIQPGPLARYLRGASSGEGADGLVQRFQLLVYPDVGEFKGVDRRPDAEAKNRAFDVFRALDALDPAAAGCDVHPDKGVAYVSFGDDAQEFFDGWYADLESRLRAKTEDARFASHLSKYRSLMPALSLIFHLIERHADPVVGSVPLRTAQMAAAWCDFLEAHARRIYQAAMDSDPEAAANLAERIKQSLPNPFTFRQVAVKGWSGLGSVEDVRKAVDTLEDRGWVCVVVEPPGPNGGRPSEQVWINPTLRPDEKAAGSVGFVGECSQEYARNGAP